MSNVVLYDTTLRDGTQMEGINLTVDDKLLITEKLDEIGIHIIEGGTPTSNPKDIEYFQRVRGLNLKNAQISAFGLTRRTDITPEFDKNLESLLQSEAPIITLVGKSDIRHVTQIIETTEAENLRMIEESIEYLLKHNRRVIFDAEHFFDGYKYDPKYALQTLKIAAEAGAESVDLCDTNGGTLPNELPAIIAAVLPGVKTRIGIHCHNDCDVAVANSLIAFDQGILQIQGAVNGWGERTGNANILSIIANLKTKKHVDCVSDEQLGLLTEISHIIDGIANISPKASQPFVGDSAFAHKGGIHAAAIAKWEDSYQHMTPESVGNHKRVLVSELSGRQNVIAKAEEVGLEIANDQVLVQRVLERVKEQENLGFHYEGADASFELLIRKESANYVPKFHLVNYTVIVGKHQTDTKRFENDEARSEATVKVQVGNKVYFDAADGNGPVNALDGALRKALRDKFPQVDTVQLTDFKVRILEEREGTEAQVRVLIESTDGTNLWRTVGSSANLIEASWIALTDSLEYWLLKWGDADPKQI
ncbi:MAG: citramalate synthase [SAR202 cluster bacterium]|nr:citramalate synthase [SAR202 cluster bacterium]